MKQPKVQSSKRDSMATRAMNPARFLWLGMIMAGLVFAGCAVAPPAASNPKPQTGPQLKSPAGHFGGIGLQLGMKDGTLTVISTVKDTPAFQAGLRPGDIIVEIDGEATRTMTLPEAVNKVRGEVGTTVKLKSVRPSTQETKASTITRADITNWLAQPGGQGSSSGLPTTLPSPAEPANPF
jgi:membrane-associated protease RseP (regulator of RpoE activity)